MPTLLAAANEHGVAIHATGPQPPSAPAVLRAGTRHACCTPTALTPTVAGTIRHRAGIGHSCEQHGG